MSRLQLRRALPGDLCPLQFFCDTVLRRDYFVRRGQLHEMVTGRRHVVWLAELDRVLVGLAIVTRPGRLVNALVHPAYRGLGLGRALLHAARPQAIRVKTNMSTGDPRPFYRKLGFAPNGTRNPRGTIELFLPDAPATSAPDVHPPVAQGDHTDVA